MSKHVSSASSSATDHDLEPILNRFTLSSASPAIRGSCDHSLSNPKPPRRPRVRRLGANSNSRASRGGGSHSRRRREHQAHQAALSSQRSPIPSHSWNGFDHIQDVSRISALVSGSLLPSPRVRIDASTGRIRRVLILLSFHPTFNSFSGVQAINYYSPRIFEQLGFKGSKNALFATGSSASLPLPFLFRRY